MLELIARAALCVALLTSAQGLAQDAPAPAAGGPTGVVAGTILDKATGDPVIEAGVEVLGENIKTKTDLDGKFAIKLPPGDYQLRIYAPLYQGVRLENVHVKPDATTHADASLAAAVAAGTEVVEVVAQAKKAAEATQILKRQKADNVQDNISAEQIRKSADSDAAEIVQRAPAVTVKDDKFIVVRGLGERYSSALLNGSRLPSTDPEKRVVPLDLFPSEFLESLSIMKSYTPNLPGDFSGGLVDIDLRDFPDELEANVAFSTGANTSTTFKRFRTYKGSDLDALGFGRNFRDLPDAFGDQPIGTLATPAQQEHFASSLKNIWAVESETAPPNGGVNFSVGNSWGPLGFELAGVYTTEWKTRRDQVERQFVNAAAIDQPPNIVLSDDFVYDTSTFETRLGGILTSGYKLNDTNKFTLRALINRNSYDNVQEGAGSSIQFGPGFTELNTNLRYLEEELDYAQLGGEHKLLPWLETNWRTALSRTTQYIPDDRNYSYLQQLNLPPIYIPDPTSGLRQFSELAEYMTDTQVDFRIPFKTWLPFTDVWNGHPADFKFGPAYTYRDRNYALRSLSFRAGAPEDLTLPPEQLFNPKQIGNGLEFQEITDPRDRFGATQEIYAGYGMLEVPIVPDWVRLIAGVRVEYSLIRLSTFDLDGAPLKVNLKDVDPLPGVNLVFTPRKDMNVRLGYSQTVARPEFRELSPVLFQRPRGLRATIGNPFLVQTDITNYEARWEWFFSPSELVSLGFFYKNLDRPIEQTVVTSGSEAVNSFANADSAELKGFEFEGRKDFGFVWEPLRQLSLNLNVAYIDSEVQASRSGGQAQTSTNRALQGQAPFVVNAALEYQIPHWLTARILYNTAGDYITNVGAFGLPDINALRRDQLDLALVMPLKELTGYDFTAKFTVENMLNDRYEVFQGSALQSRWLNGTKFGLGIGYSY
jgi:hypothetical protein